MTETWEERMAAKARARKDEQDAVEREENRVETQASWESFVQEAMKGLTVEKALEEEARIKANPIWCACSTWGPACCQVRYEARQRVLK